MCPTILFLGLTLGTHLSAICANPVVSVPEVNLAHCFFLVSKVANYRKFNFVGIFETKLFFPCIENSDCVLSGI